VPEGSIQPGRTVLVLGAGASLAEAIGHHPKRDRLHPPLDRTFFSRAARHIRNEPKTSDRARLLNRVVSTAQDLGVADVCGQNPEISLEEHLGRLYFDLNTSATSSNIQAYYDLVRLYNSELLTTTNWMVNRNGVIRRLVQRELRTSHLSVITFNHDLLIENALATLPGSRNPGAWCLAHAYGLSDDVRPISDPSEVYILECPGDRERHIPIFKMHGSCNWVYRTRNEYPSAQVARGTRSLFLWVNKQISQSTHMATTEPVAATSRRGGRSRWYMWPLIVPPVYEKHSYITGELKRVWDDAWTALSEATRVIFWGYSFPRADLHARYFFTAVAHRNQALKQPILINPDPRSQDELWAVLQPQRVLHYRNIRAFLNEAA
jgi:hypothetical protein